MIRSESVWGRIVLPVGMALALLTAVAYVLQNRSVDENLGASAVERPLAAAAPSGEAPSSTPPNVLPTAPPTAPLSAKRQAAERFADPTQPVRVAVLPSISGSSAGDPRLEFAAVWLETVIADVDAGARPLLVLDRQELDLTLDEAELSLTGLGGHSPSAVRGHFDPLTVDRLVFLVAAADDAGDPLMQVVDTATGLMLSSRPLPQAVLDSVAADNAEALLADLRGELAEPVSSRTVVAVSPVADARLQPGGDRLAQTLTERVARGLQRPDRIQLELREAQALGTELTLGGGGTLASKALPWQVLLRVADVPGDPHSVRLRAVLQHGTQTLADLDLLRQADEVDGVVAAVVETFSPLIGVAEAAMPDGQVIAAELRSRAEQLLANAQMDEGLDLMETALLYTPDDAGMRCKVINNLYRTIKAALQPFRFPLDPEQEQVFASVRSRIEQQQQRILDHSWALATLTAGRPWPDTREYPLVPQRDFKLLQRLYSSIRTRDAFGDDLWVCPPQLETFYRSIEAFKLRLLALIRRHPARRGAGEHGKNISMLMWLAAHPGVGLTEDPALTADRLATEVYLRELISKRNGRLISFGNNNVRRAPRATVKAAIEAIDALLPAVENHRTRMALDDLRRRACRRLIEADDSVKRVWFEDTDLPGTWPPGLAPATSETQDSSQWDTIRRAAGYETLPMVQPKPLFGERIFGRRDYFAGVEPCGRWGDLVWTHYRVLLLHPSGGYRELFTRDETSQKNANGWVRNVTFDGAHVWLLLPGAETRLLRIDPETGVRNTYGADQGLPPSADGGSAVAYAPGRGVAFGCFKEGGHLRTWYADFDATGAELTVRVLRSDKSVSEAEARVPGDSGGEHSLKAGYANRLVVCRRETPAPAVRVVGEVMTGPHKKMGDHANYPVQAVVIDPESGSVRPAAPQSRGTPYVLRNWTRVRDGRLLYADWTLHPGMEYDPFLDRHLPAQACIQLGTNGLYSSTQFSPHGLFGVLGMEYFRKQGTQMLLCQAAEPRHPVRPVARMLMKHRLDVAGWSEHHGLLLVNDQQELYALPESEVLQWPEPRLDFGLLADRWNPLASAGFYPGDSLSWLALARRYPGNGENGYTEAEAHEMARVYGSQVPPQDLRDDAASLLVDRRRQSGDKLRVWTSMRTSVVPEPQGAVRRVLNDSELLPAGDKSGYPVTLGLEGLTSASPDERHDVALPFRLEKAEDPGPLRGLVPRVVELPAGTATVGLSPEAPLYSSNPRREVTIRPGVFMMENEMSAWQFKSLVNPDSVKNLTEKQRNVMAWQAAKTGSSAYLIRSLCHRLRELTGEHWRLPTEAEWEYACRAGQSGPGPSEQQLLKIGTIRHAGNPRPNHFIRQHPPNAWGFYDMHGGVAEAVVADADAEDFERWVNKKASRTPYLITRGGGAYDRAQDCRYDSRARLPNDGGIRLVVDRSTPIASP